VELRFIDEFEHGIGWVREDDTLQRASHAVRIGDSVWLTDVLDGPGVDESIRELGEPKAVVQLLDRHERDCPALASRLGIPLHETPFDGVPGAPFEVIPVVRSRFWKEVALWFPDERILVVGDALGTAVNTASQVADSAASMASSAASATSTPASRSLSRPLPYFGSG